MIYYLLPLACLLCTKRKTKHSFFIVASSLLVCHLVISFCFHQCSIRKETIRIDWAAYPHYEAPETFAPFILDDSHLYYVNAFESAASAMETGAVSGENIARLILSRLSAEVISGLPSVKSTTFSSRRDDLYSDL